MKRIQHITLTLVLCLATTLAKATPQLPTTCKVYRPQLLLSYTVKESQLNDILPQSKKKKRSTWGQTGASTNRYWNVFSDRSSNKVYEQPSTRSNSCGHLNFNEEVRIAEIKDGFALVYTEEQSGTQYPNISRRAKCKGWIPMDNLLLWSDCPTNEYGIYNKAIIVGNIDKLADSQHIGNYYTNPTTQEGKAALRSTMNFYFVMKRDAESGLVLLAKESRVGGKIKDVLYGWVSEGMYSPWSQRTCLEPNWKSEVVSELKGEKVPVYTSVNGKNAAVATSIEMGARKNSVSSNNPATVYRMEPNILRYPLLDNDKKNDVYRITAFARSGSASAEATIAATAKAEAATQKSIDAMREVNIIMVIDGTKGMEKFFTVALEAIKRANEYFGKENRNVKAGVVIYRDYADGDYVTEYLPMRHAQDVSISDFLRKGGRHGVKSSPKDRTDTEALFKGLEVALDAGKMGYSPLNSNLMFVIGDCGNDPSDTKCLSQDAIVKKCVDNHIQLLSFQVRNIQSRAYNLFRKQMGDIVVENMKQQYAKLGTGDKIRFKELEDGYDAVSDVAKESTFFIGGIRNARNGKEMDASRLYALVQSTSKQFNDAVDNQESKLTTSAITDDALSSIDANFIKNRIGAENFKALRDNKYLTAFEGFVHKKSPNNVDYWQPVVYISHPEYLKLMEQLKPVMEAANTGNENRKPYIDAMKALVRSMLPDISESEMNRMDNTEIMNKIMGLNVRTKALESHSLIDIQSEQKVSKQQFDAIITDFSDNYKKLDRIGQSTYAFSTRRNGVRWYWIPAEDLP